MRAMREQLLICAAMRELFRAIPVVLLVYPERRAECRR
jgi:hypothetical protein